MASGQKRLMKHISKMRHLRVFACCGGDLCDSERRLDGFGLTGME